MGRTFSKTPDFFRNIPGRKGKYLSSKFMLFTLFLPTLPHILTSSRVHAFILQQAKPLAPSLCLQGHLSTAKGWPRADGEKVRTRKIAVLCSWSMFIFNRCHAEIQRDQLYLMSIFSSNLTPLTQNLSLNIIVLISNMTDQIFSVYISQQLLQQAPGKILWRPSPNAVLKPYFKFSWMICRSCRCTEASLGEINKKIPSRLHCGRNFSRHQYFRRLFTALFHLKDKSDSTWSSITKKLLHVMTLVIENWNEVRGS